MRYRIPLLLAVFAALTAFAVINTETAFWALAVPALTVLLGMPLLAWRGRARS
jgi:hypothetical protein